MSWVETQVPCMLYCGPELCNCSAYYFYEGLEEDEDWSIADKKGLAVNRAYAKYLSKLQESLLSECPDRGAAQSRVIYMSSESGTITA